MDRARSTSCTRCSFFCSFLLRRRILRRVGDEASASSILGANFCAAFVAGKPCCYCHLSSGCCKNAAADREIPHTSIDDEHETNIGSDTEASHICSQYAQSCLPSLHLV